MGVAVYHSGKHIVTLKIHIGLSRSRSQAGAHFCDLMIENADITSLKGDIRIVKLYSSAIGKYHITFLQNREVPMGTDPGVKSLTKCDAHLTESNFLMRSSLKMVV